MMADTALVRDRVVMTPHFNDVGIGTDPDTLCEDLATALQTYFLPANGREISVTAYDAQGTPPVLPQGNAIRNVGLAPVSSSPREVALCLSFYAGTNTPRRRGRLYIPYFAISTSSAGGPRPGSVDRTKVGALVPILTGLGGTDVDWCVYSRVDDTPHAVTNWWVDDEWDTQRTRGLRSTTRTVGTTSEGGP